MAKKNSTTSSENGESQVMQEPSLKGKPLHSRGTELLTPSELRSLKEDMRQARKYLREKAWPHLRKPKQS